MQPVYSLQQISLLPGQLQTCCSHCCRLRSLAQPKAACLYLSHSSLHRTCTDSSSRVTAHAVKREQKSNTTPAEDDDDDVPFEKEMKNRKNKKRKKATVQDLQPDPLPAKPATTDKMPFNVQLDAAAVTALTALFVAILAQGLFLALSGFLPESWDKFATDVVYNTFSPSLAIFLAGSAGYGVWRSKQGREQ